MPGKHGVSELEKSAAICPQPGAHESVRQELVCRGDFQRRRMGDKEGGGRESGSKWGRREMTGD